MKTPLLPAVFAALLLLPTLSRGTVVIAGAGVVANYRQEGSAAPVPSASYQYPAYEFSAFVGETSVTSEFSAGQLSTPGAGYVQDMTHYSGPEWNVSIDMEGVPNWQNVFTDGTYSVTLNKDGGESLAVPYDCTFGDYPPAPVVHDLPALQALDPSGDIMLAWNAWEGGTAEDSIVVLVQNSGGDVFSTPSPGHEGALDGTATTCTIPADTLVTGDTYYVAIKFVHVLSSATGVIAGYPHAVVTTFQDSRTNFEIRTTGKLPLANMLDFSIRCDATLLVNTLDGTVSSAALIAGNLQETISVCLVEPSAAEVSDVSLTGPLGSGIVNLHPDSSDNDDDYSFYMFRNLPVFLPNGSYALDLGPDRFVSVGNLDYALQADDVIIPSISLTLSGGKVTAISWEARKADGSATVFPNDEEDSFWVSAYTWDGSFAVFQNVLGTQNTTIRIPGGIPLTELSMVNVSYSQTTNAEGMSNSAGMNATITAGDMANPFAVLSHDASGWIAPQGAEAECFGWMSDRFFPFVYCAGLDALAHSGTYTGDGSGWAYVAAGASLSRGFYLYRFATGTWCWTNFNWHGWIYDYGKDGVPAGWVDITE
jgi:hypothetical protein